jgi:hypothetical protein
MSDIIEQSKQAVLAAHPDIAITNAMNLSGLLSDTFLPGAQSVMIATQDMKWFVFWYEGAHIILSEQDMQTTSVADAIGQLRLRASEMQEVRHD